MRKTNDRQPSSSSAPEAEFGFGYFYRTLEEHVNAFATQEGNPYTLTDIAVRVGELLQAKALRESLRDSELVPQVRTERAGTRLRGTGETGAALYVRAHAGRTLSKKARKAIAKAQKARWAIFHAQQGKQAKPDNRALAQTARRERERLKKAAQRASKYRVKVKGTNVDLRRGASGIKNFWARMSKAERSAEMLRRRQVSAGKAPSESHRVNGAAVA